MKALRKYRVVTGRYDLKVGIWDNCMEVIETNGRRIRVRYDYVRWSGNNGSLDEKVIYFDRAHGRRILRSYRNQQIKEMRNGWAERLDYLVGGY